MSNDFKLGQINFHPYANIKEINEFISQLIDACRDYRKELDDKTNEVARLCELLENILDAVPASYREQYEQIIK